MCCGERESLTWRCLAYDTVIITRPKDLGPVAKLKVKVKAKVKAGKEKEEKKEKEVREKRRGWKRKGKRRQKLKRSQPFWYTRARSVPKLYGAISLHSLDLLGPCSWCQERC